MNLTIGSYPGNPCNIINNPGVKNCFDRPDDVGSITYPHTVGQWFSVGNFAAPAAAWGNLGHNAIRGPGRDNWNLSLLKISCSANRGEAACNSVRNSLTSGTIPNSRETLGTVGSPIQSLSWRQLVGNLQHSRQTRTPARSLQLSIHGSPTWLEISPLKLHPLQ